MARPGEPTGRTLGDSGPQSRSLLDSLSDALFIHDLSGRFLDVNAVACERLGYSRAELLGRTPADISSPPHAEQMASRIDEVFRKGGMVFETVHVSRDGREIPTEVNSRVIEREGQPAILSVARDITQRKQAEDALGQSEEKYSNLFHGSNDGIFIHDLDGAILDVNEKALDQFGYERSEILSLKITDLHPPEALDGSRRAFEAIARDGVANFEIDFRTQSGDVFPAEVSASLFEVAGRKLIQGIVRDITARKQAERAVRDAEHEKETILESLVEHVVHQDPALKILWANQAACESANMTRGELIGRHCYEVWACRETPCPDCPVAQAMETGRPAETEKTTPDGRAWYIRGYPVRDADGKMIGGIEVTLEITDRKQAERERSASAERYRQLYEGSRDGYGQVDLSGRIVASNSALWDMLGYTEEELRRKTYEDITPRRWHAEEGRILDEQVLRRGYSDVYEKEYVRKDGSVIPVEIRTYLLTDASGETTGMWAFVRDITERRQLEEQFRQAQKMEAVGRLAGGIAHDFNNQLTVIKGYCDLLLAGGDVGPVRDELGEIRQACERSERLTNQLLAFSRKQVLRPEVTDLNEVLMEMSNPLSRMIGEDVELSIVADPYLGSVRVDRSQVQQAVMNLAVNARDAMPAGGKLVLETANVELGDDYARQHPGASTGPHVMLAVSDTGTGMDAETTQRIFEPFFTTKEVGKGTGLGLSMVYGFVRQSGGSTYVYSEPGRGTTLKVYLPRVFEPAEHLAPADDGDVPGGSETVLVAEDDEVVRRFLVRALRTYGYTVLEACSAREALSLGRDSPGDIHLLVADVIMPAASGPELAERLQAARPGLKVLFVSGYTREATVQQGVLRPGTNLLSKPFGPAQLARMVRRVLGEAPAPAGEDD